MSSVLLLPDELLTEQLALRLFAVLSCSYSINMLFVLFSKLECSVVLVLLSLIVCRVELATVAVAAAAAAAEKEIGPEGERFAGSSSNTRQVVGLWRAIWASCLLIFLL